MSQIVSIYQAAFAEPPWNENWSEKEIIQDFRFALSQKNPIVLVSEYNGILSGFSWGYKIPFEKFPFLKGKISENSSYIDEIAVRRENRFSRIGTDLGRMYLETARKQGIGEVCLRTDEGNISSMALFRKLGFNDLKIYDPEFAQRIYLARTVEGAREGPSSPLENLTLASLIKSKKLIKLPLRRQNE